MHLKCSQIQSIAHIELINLMRQMSIGDHLSWPMKIFHCVVLESGNCEVQGRPCGIGVKVLGVCTV